MQRQLPAPMQIPQQRSSGFNTMLQIGNAALGGIQAYGALAPPAAGGFDLNQTQLGAGGGSVGGLGTLGPNFGFRQ